jgi:hypothetical protein
MNRAELIAKFKSLLDTGPTEDDPRMMKVIELASKWNTREPTVCDRARNARVRVLEGGPVSGPAVENVKKASVAQDRRGMFTWVAKRDERPVITTGKFTVVFDDGHVTLKVYEQSSKKDFMPGRLLVARLIGADNQADFKDVGVVGERLDRVFLWKKHRSDERLQKAVDVLAGNPQACADAFALETACCPYCGRELSNPQSLWNMCGETCAEKHGVPYEKPPADWKPELWKTINVRNPYTGTPEQMAELMKNTCDRCGKEKTEQELCSFRDGPNTFQTVDWCEDCVDTYGQPGDVVQEEY